MEKNISKLLFNAEFLILEDSESLRKELISICHFNISQNDIEHIIISRNKQLVDRGLIDFSTSILVEATKILVENQKLTKKEWKVQLSDFTEIFYELRQITPTNIDDFEIINAINKKIYEFDNDFNRVAGYFETNYILNGVNDYE